MTPKLTFPDLGKQMSTQPARVDEHGRRSWIVTVEPGAARKVEAFFNQCRGKFRAFTFAPSTGEKVTARFDTDSLPMTQIAKNEWRCEPFPIIELIGE